MVLLNNWWQRMTNFRRYWKQEQNRAGIELPNGAKCNADFFWMAVELGILNEDD
jgi:hypothetical protein